MFLVYHIVEKNKIQKVQCANQSHLMQMVDGWGFQRVLHYSSPTGVEGVVYCHAVGDSALADREMCLVVTTVSKVPIRLQDISRFVLEHYQTDAHPPLRLQMTGHTPNGGSLRTTAELSSWCDGSTDALTRYHTIINVLLSNNKKRSRDGAVLANARLSGAGYILKGGYPPVH